MYTLYIFFFGFRAKANKYCISPRHTLPLISNLKILYNPVSLNLFVRHTHIALIWFLWLPPYVSFPSLSLSLSLSLRIFIYLSIYFSICLYVSFKYFRSIIGDSGAMGGSLSHEYHFPADIGEWNIETVFYKLTMRCMRFHPESHLKDIRSSPFWLDS